MVEYADLECPFCRAYFAVLKRWIDAHPEVPGSGITCRCRCTSPAASADARLVECVGQASGHAAFWQAVEWVYAHTAATGRACPRAWAIPTSRPAAQQCLDSDRPRCGDPRAVGRAPRRSTSPPRPRCACRTASPARRCCCTARSKVTPAVRHRPAGRRRRRARIEGNACRVHRRHAQVATIFKATTRLLQRADRPVRFASFGREQPLHAVADARSSVCSQFIVPGGGPSRAGVLPLHPSEVRHVPRRRRLPSVRSRSA